MISIPQKNNKSHSTKEAQIVALVKKTQIAIATHDGFHLINISDIIYLQADNNYCTFHLLDGSSVTCSRCIGHYSDKAALNNFLRVHRSFLVNPNSIKRIFNGNRNEILLVGGKCVPLARSHKKDMSLFISKFL